MSNMVYNFVSLDYTMDSILYLPHGLHDLKDNFINLYHEAHLAVFHLNITERFAWCIEQIERIDIKANEVILLRELFPHAHEKHLRTLFGKTLWEQYFKVDINLRELSQELVLDNETEKKKINNTSLIQEPLIEIRESSQELVVEDESDNKKKKRVLKKKETIKRKGIK